MAYLCFCGPLIALLLLTATVSAVWNELSVYELERKKTTSAQLEEVMRELALSYLNPSLISYIS